MSSRQPGVVTVATEESFDLAEGPVWDPLRQRLLWVDIRSGTVLSGTLRDDGTIRVAERVTFSGMVGAVAVSATGDWIVAGERAIFTRSPAGEIGTGPAVLAADSGRRLNDGKPDAEGRFVVGTLKLDETETHEERLVVIQPDGRLDDLDSDLGLSNGLAWSGDGSTLYSIDTAARVVYVRRYDRESGHAGPRRVLIAFEEGVYPDGMCVDVEEHLWVAIWGGGQVRRYSPDGVFDRSIEVPAPHTTSVTFAGPELATMVITTATKDLGDAQLTAFPLSGRLFTVDAGVGGLAPVAWSGLPDTRLPTPSSL